eukprot:CAMPEP_0175127974 /NCGR_PEP_ID=MMETSP0087-20121206/4678_1 /TAXON_ID=136419 /ORGANISM="Unknown Unknown, Strain D1" /LENGTH=251 /DNA_ID=CAMNT_0016409999 /DNA_START=249 /DNA_END=1004 /DNA_ORIENTATION=+
MYEKVGGFNNSNDVIYFDIGGNHGNYASNVLKTWPKPQTHVYAFELDPNNFQKHLQPLAGTQPNLHAINKGVSNTANVEDVWVYPGFDQRSRIGGGSTVNGVKWQQHGQVETVQLATWVEDSSSHPLHRDMKGKIAYVKIDTEGWESRVIQGMLLQQKAEVFPLLHFEAGAGWIETKAISYQQQIEELDQAGYDCYLIHAEQKLLQVNKEFWVPMMEEMAKLYGSNTFCCLRSHPVHAVLQDFHIGPETKA